MKFMDLFKKRGKSILRPEDIQTLNELERNAYIEEAKKLVVERGKAEAKNHIKIVQEDY